MLQLERRASDFESSGAVVGYSGGCCCCCCCLHWVGAVVGGAGGLIVAKRRSKGRPLHPRAWRYLLAGFVLGLLVTVATAVVLPAFVLGALAFVPSLVFVLPGLGMMLMGDWHRIRKRGTSDLESLNCLSCQYDLRSHFREQRCPECGDAALQQEMSAGADDRSRAAGPGMLRSTGLLLFAFSPSIIHRLVMYLAWTLMGDAMRQAGVILVFYYVGLVAVAAVVCWRAALRLCSPLALGRRGWLAVAYVTLGLLAINLALVRFNIHIPGVHRGYFYLIINSVVIAPLVAFVLSAGIRGGLVARHTRRPGTASDTPGHSCLRCGRDLSDQLREQLCPECGAAIDWPRLTQAMHSGLDYGWDFAWRMTWISVVCSTVLSVVGYLIMLPFLFG